MRLSRRAQIQLSANGSLSGDTNEGRAVLAWASLRKGRPGLSNMHPVLCGPWLYMVDYKRSGLKEATVITLPCTLKPVLFELPDFYPWPSSILEDNTTFLNLMQSPGRKTTWNKRTAGEMLTNLYLNCLVPVCNHLHLLPNEIKNHTFIYERLL